jgi:hypothetical protein
MKKLFYLLVFVFAGFIANAQNPSFSPSSFTAEDQVTITVDVTGTAMAGSADAYIWIFSNPDGTGGNDGFTNTNWTNSPDVAKMTAAGTNKWSYTFTGTAMFGKSPAELSSFGFLLKKKDGSAQTPDYKPYHFDPLVFTPTVLRIFPAKVGIDDIVTVNFDPTYGITVNEKRMTPTSVTITLYERVPPVPPALETTLAQIGTPLTLTLKNTPGTPIWSATFIPSARFTIPISVNPIEFKYHFNGTVLDVTGAPTPVTSSESEVIFTKMK